MKKIFLMLVFAGVLMTSLFSQVSVNPEDSFYSDSLNWYLKGYVEKLPQLKPYPVNVIKGILSEVIEKGEEVEKAKAEEYYFSIFGEKFHIESDSAYLSKIYSLNDTDNENAERWAYHQQIYSKIAAGGDFAINDFLGTGLLASIQGQGSYAENTEVLYRELENNPLKVMEPFTFSAGNLDFLTDFSGIVTFGTSEVYATAGFNTFGYGLFPDSDLMLSPSGNHFLNASFNYEGKYIQYAQIFGLTGASGNKVNNLTDYTMTKYFTFHSLSVPLFDNRLKISYFEGSAYGKHFNPALVTPMPWVIVSNVNGKTEDVYAGGKIEFKPVKCFSWNTEVVLKDLQLKPFIKLHWDDASIRGAFKTGFTYAPLDSIVNLITFDYALVTPYTFTSYDAFNENYNYRSYTNFGEPIGINLLPNSDRLSLKINFHPFKPLKITTLTAYSRHANTFEMLSQSDALLLSQTSYGYTGTDWTTTNLNLSSEKKKTSFLTQDSKMYTMQAGLNLQYEVYAGKRTKVILDAGYTFEFIQKDGVDDPVFTVVYALPTDYVTVPAEDEGITDEMSDEEKEAVREANRQKQEYRKLLDGWKAHLHDSYNHYFKAGVKIIF